ncbi:MAG: alpha/beta fold hydrolase [Planctomycetota bacterium]
MNTSPSDADYQCVWFNHAGGTPNTLAYRFRQASEELSNNGLPLAEVLTPVVPLREDAATEVFAGEVHDLADQYVETLIQDGIGSKPVVIIGHSYGTVLAYEVTCRLVARGIMPHRLIVMSFPAPDRLTHQTQLHTLDDEALVEQVDELFGGIPLEMKSDPEALTFFVPGLRFDLGLLERYQPKKDQVPLDLPVTAMLGTDDRAVDLADVHRWNQFASQPVRLQTLPGDHFFPLVRLPEVLEAAVWDLASPAP